MGVINTAIPIFNNSQHVFERESFKKVVLDTSNVFSRNLKAYLDSKIKTIINQGGTSSSKTFSIMQLLVLIAQKNKTVDNLLISVVSESLPHLKRGCIRDFKNIMGAMWEDKRWNKTEKIYTFDNSTIEFFPADKASKLRGGRRHILYINECNNVTKHAFDELEVRTYKKVFLDYNPVCEFWAHELIGEDGTEYIHSTYLDSKHILEKYCPEIVKAIEARRYRDPNWWKVYGLGETGALEGLVHPNFKIIEGMPEGGIHFYGLDFGFSNDPTALIHCCVLGDALVCDQLIYQKGLTNDEIAKKMISLGIRRNYDEIWADTEPKSIKEIQLYGFNIKKVPDKGIATGIQKVNQYRLYWTKRSVESIKENRNYRYIEDNTGRMTAKPMDMWNHSMDGRRYGVMGKFYGMETILDDKVF